ncbi:GNAT family N-acetyltransferase [Microbacterium marinilacus]|uniref:GNAT family N-acetyltransferase n=1 Tax=Microbacterium marinilacus TaxID=415209 RepID=A0ABP7B2N7_9MICO|nr:GNAT family N-acetyltransferase [Microbacterium marinilacus]MBY0688707.1 GNAT family N-acetyltransferase [Microbacterium marinilacus]
MIERTLPEDIRLRPLAEGDGAALASAYRRNREHLAPWEPLRTEDFYTSASQDAQLRLALGEQRRGAASRWVLEDADARIVGRLNVTDIVRGAAQSASVGYWTERELAGRGIMTAALRSVAAHCRDQLGLHRLQAGTLLHNAASQRVLERSGFERFGLAVAYLRIAGEWQDHLLFQRILED